MQFNENFSESNYAVPKLRVVHIYSLECYMKCRRLTDKRGCQQAEL